MYIHVLLQYTFYYVIKATNSTLIPNISLSSRTCLWSYLMSIIPQPLLDKQNKGLTASSQQLQTY